MVRGLLRMATGRLRFPCPSGSCCFGGLSRYPYVDPAGGTVHWHDIPGHPDWKESSVTITQKKP